MLPGFESSCSSTTVDDFDTQSVSLSATDESEILSYYRSDSTISNPCSGESSSSSVFPEDEINLKPPPLYIRKTSDSSSEYGMVNEDVSLIAQTLPDSPSPQVHTAVSTRPMPEGPARSTLDWQYIDSLERYNNHLSSFATMLNNHIHVTEHLIRTTKEAQSMRYFSKRLASYGEDETAKAVDLKARIERLKAKGWERERFAPERYQRLCERALDELWV